MRSSADTAARRRGSTYDAATVEQRWQARWAAEGCFRASRRPDAEHFYNFDGGPFPNGPLHMGHVRTFTLGDVMARYQRMRGKAVLYCFEFDAFGLPNELAAEARGVSPADLTAANIQRMRDQMTRLGLSYDWNHVHTTSDPAYYRWTQWLFLRLHEAGLVYRGEAALNWCRSCHTTLAHIQVEDGTCWRCHNPVERRVMPQWYVALSRYSGRLAATLDDVEGLGGRVRNVLAGFLGETAGVEIDLALIDPPGETITAFVAPERGAVRADFVAMSPEHPLPRGSGREGSAMRGKRQRRDRAAGHGIDAWDTGLRATDPRSGATLPVLVADHVDAQFAHGATLGFPDHDPRDEAIAAALGIQPSAPADAATSDHGRPATHYRVHDWLVSRQRAWGTPIPFVHCGTCGVVPVAYDDLPVLLPDIPPGGARDGLAGIAGFAETACPSCGGPARRETDTLDCYLDVIWCFLACATRLDDGFSFAAEDFASWMPVDWFHNGLDSYFYMHLYRFIGHVLHDLGLLAEPEPFRNYAGHDVVTLAGRKMSKHHGNVVDPSAILDEVGADVLRVHVLWSANPNKGFDWSDDGVQRARALLSDIWSLMTAPLAPVDGFDLPVSKTARAIEAEQARTVRRATSFIERYQYAGALHEIHKFTQALKKAARNASGDDRAVTAAVSAARLVLVRLITPFAPHLAEEAWHGLGQSGLIADATWPECAPASSRSRYSAA